MERLEAWKAPVLAEERFTLDPCFHAEPWLFFGNIKEERHPAKHAIARILQGQAERILKPPLGQKSRLFFLKRAGLARGLSPASLAWAVRSPGLEIPLSYGQRDFLAIASLEVDAGRVLEWGAGSRETLQRRPQGRRVDGGQDAKLQLLTKCQGPNQDLESWSLDENLVEAGPKSKVLQHFCPGKLVAGIGQDEAQGREIVSDGDGMKLRGVIPALPAHANMKPTVEGARVTLHRMERTSFDSQARRAHHF